VASGNSAHAVLWRERHTDADVLGNADLALYRANAGGRNTFCFFNADIEKATLARHRRAANGAFDPKPFQRLLLAFTPFVTLQKSGFSAFGTSESLLL
jgi:hypothetical protein